MIESTNKDYGFFGTIKNSRMVDQFTSKLFDIAGQGVKEAFGCTDDEAAAVLDSRIGRHLADVVTDADPTSLRVNVNSWISKRSWAKEVREVLKFVRQEKQEEMGESRRMVGELPEASEHYLSKTIVMKNKLSETSSRFLKLVEDSSLGGDCKVTFDGLEIGIYDTLDGMQNGVAEHIFNDLSNTMGGEEGYDYDSLRDEAIEQSLLVVDAFKDNDSPADASVISVKVVGDVDSYNGTWTFEFLE